MTHRLTSGDYLTRQLVKQLPPPSDEAKYLDDLVNRASDALLHRRSSVEGLQLVTYYDGRSYPSWNDSGRDFGITRAAGREIVTWEESAGPWRVVLVPSASSLARLEPGEEHFRLVNALVLEQYRSNLYDDTIWPTMVATLEGL